MKRNFFRAIGWALGIIFLDAIHAGADVIEQGPVLSLTEENDLFVKTDRHYTQGIRLAYLAPDQFFPFGPTNFYSKLPPLGLEESVGKFGFSIGQNIYTPSDILSPAPQPSDRPYAGWLYVGAILQRRGVSLADLPTMEELDVELGMIGPWSLAKDAQIWVHQIRSFDIPRGWGFQLKNEPGLRIKYQRSIRLPVFGSKIFAGEFLPHAGFSFGNVETSFRVGGLFRMGFYLPDDYGPQTIDSLGTGGSGRAMKRELRSIWSAYTFAGLEGRTVAHNVFLDGNLFRRSPNIDKEIVVGDFKMGFGCAYRALEAGYVYVWRSPEFKGQLADDAFGSVFIRLRF